MPQRRVTVTLSEELYEELLKHDNKAKFVRDVLQAHVTRLQQCDIAAQIRDYCTKEAECDRALCSELDGGADDGTTAQG